MAYQLTSGNSVIRLDDGAVIPNDPANVDWQTYQGWLAAGNTPQPVPPPPPLTPQQKAAQLIAAGIQIVSTGTPALNGTYAIDDSAKAVIDGIYAGIKNGDGLPGGGFTFNYPDIAGTFHSFDAVSFPNFAKKTRDYLYSISQGAPLAQPVSIP